MIDLGTAMRQPVRLSNVGIDGGHPPHHFDVFMDRCIYCGARRNAIEDNLASPNCDIYKQVAMPRIVVPVSIGIIITFIMLWGLIHG